MIESYFAPDELVCKCGCGGMPHLVLIAKLNAVREKCGFPLIVSSGFRCSEHNKKVAKSGAKGPHTTGFAVDIRIDGEKAWTLIKVATQYGFTGIGVSQKDGEPGFVHLDMLTKESGFIRPNLWSY